MPTKEMIATHPDVHGNINQALIDAIDAATPVLKLVGRVLMPALPKRWLPGCVSASISTWTVQTSAMRWRRSAAVEPVPTRK